MMGHFGVESFHQIDCTDTDNQKQSNKIMHMKHKAKTNTKNCPSTDIKIQKPGLVTVYDKLPVLSATLKPDMGFVKVGLCSFLSVCVCYEGWHTCLSLL